MATVLWSPNAAPVSQLDTVVITAVAVAGTITLTIGISPTTQSVTYTCVTGDTTATAASGLLALLQASTVPPMFQEITWAIGATTSTITATATTPGTPFTMAKSQAGSATCTLTHTTANVSPSDVNDTNNWLRAGAAAIPANGDTVVAANSSIPMLWNLDLLAAVQFVSWRRDQTMTGQIGLPDQNANGYREYRPTYFQFSCSGTVTLYLGTDESSAGGPAFERYDLAAIQSILSVAGGTLIDFKSTSTANTATITGANVILGPLVSDAPGLSTATVDGGGTLTLGPGVVGTPTITVNGGLLNAAAACSITATNGSTVNVNSTGKTHVAITATGGSTINWLSNSTITTLALTTGSTFSKSQDVRAMTVTTMTMDTDCLINDPVNVITFTNATTWNTRGGIAPGPYQFAGTRTVTIV